MSDLIPLYLAVEDELSETMARTIVMQTGRPFHIEACFGKKGFGYLKKQIGNFNQAAPHKTFLVLADLDARTCASELITN